jgi:hypothetical protein
MSAKIRLAKRHPATLDWEVMPRQYESLQGALEATLDDNPEDVMLVFPKAWVARLRTGLRKLRSVTAILVATAEQECELEDEASNVSDYVMEVERLVRGRH